MTAADYRAHIKQLGLTPCRPSYQGRTLHQTREGLLQQVEDPEPYTPGERVALLALIKERMGIFDN